MIIVEWFFLMMVDHLVVDVHLERIEDDIEFRS